MSKGEEHLNYINFLEIYQYGGGGGVVKGVVKIDVA